MSRSPLVAFGLLLMTAAFSTACGDDDPEPTGGGGGAAPAFATPAEAVEACCDPQTREYRDEVPACAQYKDDNDLDAVEFCLLPGAGGAGAGGSGSSDNEYEADLRIVLSDGTSKSIVFSQPDNLVVDEASFSAIFSAQGFSMSVSDADPMGDGCRAFVILQGPPQTGSTWQLPNPEVPFVGVTMPAVRSYEMVSGTVELTQCAAGPNGDRYEVEIDAGLQELQGGTVTGSVSGFIRARADEQTGFTCP